MAKDGTASIGVTHVDVNTKDHDQVARGSGWSPAPRHRQLQRHEQRRTANAPARSPWPSPRNGRQRPDASPDRHRCPPAPPGPHRDPPTLDDPVRHGGPAGGDGRHGEGRPELGGGPAAWGSAGPILQPSWSAPAGGSRCTGPCASCGASTGRRRSARSPPRRSAPTFALSVTAQATCAVSAVIVNVLTVGGYRAAARRPV